MVWGTEKDITKRTRMIILVAVWVVAVPLFFGLWQISWWVALIGIAACAWGTWDYAKKGDMFGSMKGIERTGGYLPGAFRDHDNHPTD